MLKEFDVINGTIHYKPKDVGSDLGTLEGYGPK